MRQDMNTGLTAGLARRGVGVCRMIFLIFIVSVWARIGVTAQETLRAPDSHSSEIVPERTVLGREIALQEQLRATPDSIDVLVQLAELLARNGLHSASIPYWQRASKLQPADSPVHLSLALELMEEGRNDEAVAELRAIVPQSAAVLTNLGAALARDNRLEDAIAAYRKALSSQPQSSVALLSLAKALISLRRYPDALIYAKTYQQLEPDEFEGRYIEGYIYRKLGEEKEAVPALQRAIARNPTDYDAQWNLGAALLATDQPVAAIEILRHASQIKPSGTEARSLLARAYYRSGNIASADAEKEALAQIRAVNQETAALDMEGKLALSRGDTVKAVASYRRLTEIAPRDARVYYDLALSYERAGRRTEEHESLLIAEKMDPTSPDIQNQLGFLDFENGIRGPAEAHFLRALATDPAHAEALGNLGVLYAQAGNLKRAESLLRLATEVSPEKPEALRNLALVLSASGRYDDATDILQRALRLAPENEDVRLAMSIIQQQYRKIIQGNNWLPSEPKSVDSATETGH